ncbi:hypothetical protein W97_06877 [Coniosporium apollinis CBS 100218]|uniref:Glutathione S-transferase n=1 Tax=Coniosporium apollinis (strain CBS 100218) TaxID=1168221 RepID=R7Z0D4_CONA1|nr:uncharacterized protein W97_06877 [Coniosporium apollinis CBS 100218]EON67509.1 hypothetical protein W97_06877 [Coniosporium apollinis CBS 100218]
MATYEHAGSGQGVAPKITLYTHHGCPYAHRAHIALKELDLSYEEVIVDLDKPREPWYLEINPRGLVPTIKYSNGILNDEIITESAIVTQFLADSRPSHLLPASLSSPTAPLVRARINFFVDTWNTKIGGYFMKILAADSKEDKEAKSKEMVEAVKKEIEPLLKDANPFFGGSEELTFAEVQIAPFLLRIYAMANGEYLPVSLKQGLNELPNFSKWAAATMKKESVTYIWDEQRVLNRTGELIQKIKANQNK